MSHPVVKKSDEINLTPEEKLNTAVQEQNRNEAQLESWLSQGDQRAVEVVKKHICVRQETFDEAVRENIDDFEMEIQTAIDDAKTQFELQGLDCRTVDVAPGRYLST
jgi:hypothetical protein